MSTETKQPGVSISPAAAWISVDIFGRFDKETARWVAGSPQLDVWSSGTTPQQSLERADEAILLFLDEITVMGTVWKVLAEANVRIEKGEVPPRRSPGLPTRLKNLFRGQAFVPGVFPIHATA